MKDPFNERLSMRNIVPPPEAHERDVEPFDPELDILPEEWEAIRRESTGSLLQNHEDVRSFASYQAQRALLEGKRVSLTAAQKRSVKNVFGSNHPVTEAQQLQFVAHVRILGCLSDEQIKIHKSFFMRLCTEAAIITTAGLSLIVRNAALLHADDYISLPGTNTLRKEISDHRRVADYRDEVLAYILANMKIAGLLDEPVSPREWKYLRKGLVRERNKIESFAMSDGKDLEPFLSYAANMRVLASEYVHVTDEGIDMPLAKREVQKGEKPEPVPPLSHLP